MDVRYRYFSVNGGRRNFEWWNFIQGAQADIKVSKNQEEKHRQIIFLYRLYELRQNFGIDKYIGIDLNASVFLFFPNS